MISYKLYLPRLEKAADFNRWSADFQDGGSLMPPLGQTVRGKVL